jgi:malonate transporter and related proteins
VTGLGHFVALTAPLFLLVLFGYALSTFGRWPAAATDALTRFVFTVAMPALLFRLMSDFSRLPRVDTRILVAYFGGCLVVYVAGRLVGATVFRLDGVSQSVFAMGGIFSNNVLLGLPIAQVTLGEAALPGVSLILVFNSLILWTLVTVSVEWARHRELSVRGLAKTVRGVVLNPIIGSILLGTAWSFTGVALPGVVDRSIELVARAGLPLSLVVLGMGLAQFGVRAGWRISGALAAFKLVAQPAVVYGLAVLLGLSTLDAAVVVLMAALPIGANVYLMARQFDALSGPIAAGIVLTTALGAITTPFVLALAGAPVR